MGEAETHVAAKVLLNKRLSDAGLLRPTLRVQPSSSGADGDQAAAHVLATQCAASRLCRFDGVKAKYSYKLGDKDKYECRVRLGVVSKDIHFIMEQGVKKTVIPSCSAGNVEALQVKRASSLGSFWCCVSVHQGSPFFFRCEPEDISQDQFTHAAGLALAHFCHVPVDVYTDGLTPGPVRFHTDLVKHAPVFPNPFFELLQPAGMEQYAGALVESGIPFEALPVVNREDLVELVGITDRLHQIKVMSQIRKITTTLDRQTSGQTNTGRGDANASMAGAMVTMAVGYAMDAAMS